MAKWPSVPDCYGWLGLDARGDWYMRDDATQAQGPFPVAKGSRLRHDKLIEFIGRNYDADAQGRWFFQNGPQRVFVELECTPHIVRIQPDLGLSLHTGVPWQAHQAWLDEQGYLYVSDLHRVARVHTQDMVTAPDWLQVHGIQPQAVLAARLPEQFKYVPHPASQALAAGKA